MISPNILDKSDTHLITQSLLCAQVLALETLIPWERVKFNFLKDNWFALRLKKENLVNFLQYSVENQESEALSALLEAFSYPTTRRGLLALCRALFGSGAQIVLTEGPGTVDLKVKNANTSFVRWFQTAQAPQKEVVTNQRLGIVFRLFTNLGNNSLQSFFQQFLPTGVFCTLQLSDD